jgi:ribosomal protein S27AE
VAILLLLITGILIVISYEFVLRKNKKCKKCGSKSVEKTGRRREMERRKRTFAVAPLYEYEYTCKKCGHTFRNSLEKTWGD